MDGSPSSAARACSPPRVSAVRAALLGWYARVARDLPWRRTRDPYAIWVSEIMLQQTRVQTVVPYYERFMQRFPTPLALANASEDEVLAIWSGLGYYRRARLLHAGVREVRERYGGRVPRDAEARRTLPGVGRYTSGAIGSIAFGRPEPLVDGNVARVLSRVFEIDGPAGQAATDRALWDLATKLVAGPEPGALNQAVMELGAIMCTASSPACTACPLVRMCRAHEAGRVHELPRPKCRPEPKRVLLTSVAALPPRSGARQDRPPALWLTRAEGSLFGGLWNLPASEGRGRPAALVALRGLGVRARVGQQPVGELEHVLSHRALQVELWLARGARAEPTPTLRCVPSGALSKLGTSRLTRKLITLAFGT